MRNDSVFPLVFRGEKFTSDVYHRRKVFFFMSYLSHPLLIEMSTLRTVCHGVNPLVQVIVVAI